MELIKYSDMKITAVQLFDYAENRQISDDEFEIIYSYSANIAINDSFIIEMSGNKYKCSDNIPSSDIAAWSIDDAQDYAKENYDAQEIMQALNIENNVKWLEDNATDIMNKENARYRDFSIE